MDQASSTKYQVATGGKGTPYNWLWNSIGAFTIGFEVAGDTVLPGVDRIPGLVDRVFIFSSKFFLIL